MSQHFSPFCTVAYLVVSRSHMICRAFFTQTDLLFQAVGFSFCLFFWIFLLNIAKELLEKLEYENMFLLTFLTDQWSFNNCLFYMGPCAAVLIVLNNSYKWKWDIFSGCACKTWAARYSDLFIWKMFICPSYNGKELRVRYKNLLMTLAHAAWAMCFICPKEKKQHIRVVFGAHDSTKTLPNDLSFIRTTVCSSYPTF